MCHKLHAHSCAVEDLCHKRWVAGCGCPEFTAPLVSCMHGLIGMHTSGIASFGFRHPYLHQLLTDMGAFTQEWEGPRSAQQALLSSQGTDLGCTHRKLTQGVIDRKKSVLELAVRQAGPAAARLGAERAAAAASKEGSSVGIIKVLVHEVDGPAEHPVNVGAAALTLAELRVASKPGAKKPGRKKKSEQPDGEEERDDAPAADDDGAPATMLVPYITSRQPFNTPTFRLP